MTGRSVPEWIGATSDTAIPPRVKRKSPGVPLTLEYFRRRSAIDSAFGCWLWTGAKNCNGYGALRFGGKSMRPHRAVYEVVHGKTLPRTVDVCHRCDVRLCVNPDHLFEGSRADNMQDCARKGRIKIPVLKGDACPNSKLTSDQVRAIRIDGRSNRQTAAAYGVDKGTIAHIRLRKTWRSI